VQGAGQDDRTEQERCNTVEVLDSAGPSIRSAVFNPA